MTAVGRRGGEEAVDRVQELDDGWAGCNRDFMSDQLYIQYMYPEDCPGIYVYLLEGTSFSPSKSTPMRSTQPHGIISFGLAGWK